MIKKIVFVVLTVIILWFVSFWVSDTDIWD